MRSDRKFTASIKSVSIKETVSNDRETRIVIVTDDPTAVELQQFIAEQPVEVVVREVE